MISEGRDRGGQSNGGQRFAVIERKISEARDGSRYYNVREGEPTREGVVVY